MKLSIIIEECAKNSRTVISLYRLQAGVTPLTRCEISIGPQPEQYNLLTVSILIITMSSANYNGSISMIMNICEAFRSINNTSFYIVSNNCN